MENVKGTGNCREKNNLRCTIFQAQGHILDIQETTFRALLQTSLRHQKQVRHFHKGHNLNDDLNVTILENIITFAAARRYHEDK